MMYGGRYGGAVRIFIDVDDGRPSEVALIRRIRRRYHKDAAMLGPQEQHNEMPAG